MKGAVFDTP